MKTPEDWLATLGSIEDKWPTLLLFIQAIQKDAIESKTFVADLEDKINHYREKWHEARKHLRAANKGAERNAKALEYSATRYWDLVRSDRRVKERDENAHKTVVWNWLCMSDDDYRLKCGELSSQDLRNIRAVLKAMLDTHFLRHL